MAEQEGTISVTLQKGTTITGEQYEAGDSVDVYPWQVPGLVQGGYVTAEEAGDAGTYTTWPDAVQVTGEDQEQQDGGGDKPAQAERSEEGQQQRSEGEAKPAGGGKRSSRQSK